MLDAQQRSFAALAWERSTRRERILLERPYPFSGRISNAGTRVVLETADEICVMDLEQPGAPEIRIPQSVGEHIQCFTWAHDDASIVFATKTAEKEIAFRKWILAENIFETLSVYGKHEMINAIEIELFCNDRYLFIDDGYLPRVLDLSTGTPRQATYLLEKATPLDVNARVMVLRDGESARIWDVSKPISSAIRVELSSGPLMYEVNVDQSVVYLGGINHQDGAFYRSSDGRKIGAVKTGFFFARFSELTDTYYAIKKQSFFREPLVEQDKIYEIRIGAIPEAN
ncbi:hypothetical protein SH139x_004042 [Planctomycetaceae bacterium SH139]